MSLFWNVLFIASFSQGFFVSLVLLVQYFKTKLISQLYLSLFIFSFSYILLNNTVYWNSLFERFPHFLFNTTFVRYALAPLFLMYCCTFFKRPTSKWSLLHFIPPVFLFLCYLPYAFLAGADKFQLVVGNYESISIYLPLQITGRAFFPVAGHLVIYALLIFILIRAEKKRNDAASDPAQNRRLRWLGLLNMLFLIYGVMMLLYVILVLNSVGGIEKDYYISVVMCVAVYGISAVGILNPELLKGELRLKSRLKYDRTRMRPEVRQEAYRALENAMEADRAFLDPDLDLTSLSERLELPKHHISQTLSLEKGETFSEFLNRYRIEHARSLLDSMTTGDTIKEVMYASGFNNRVSFNNNFKKLLGMTASDYLNSKKNGSLSE